ncbi:MAG: helix-turn-helix domain-containing protein [Alphaproteobacteria bacterium]
MAAKPPHPIDQHVGGRVRLRRMLVGMSQEQLGEKLSLTFQQVQKYEKGANRISASKLWQISKILGVTVQFFYDGIDEAQAGAEQSFAENDQAKFAGMMQSSDGIHLSRHYYNITDPDLRRAVVDLAKTLAAKSN